MFGFLKQLFAASTESNTNPVDPKLAVEPVHYNDYLIFVMPIEEAGQYRVAGSIEKPVVGDDNAENLKHTFIRSDLCMSKQQAEQITLQKCKLFIDQVGDNMFK